MKKMFGFGINEFADPSSNLNGCVNDTVNVRRFCVDTLHVDPRNIRLLCDQRATRMNIFERLDWCSRDWPEAPVPELDQLVIQMSTHGSQILDREGDEVDDQKDEVICPHDYPSLWDSPNCEDARACQVLLGQEPKPQICDDDIAVFLRKIPKGVYTLVIVDACHSGSMNRSIMESKVKAKMIRPPVDLQSRWMDRDDVKTRPFGHKPGIEIRPRDHANVHFIEQNHILLSGCRDDQTSADAMIDSSYQGAMTWSLLDSLKKTGFMDGGAPTWLEVHDEMVSTLHDQGYSQVPQLTGPEDLLNDPVFMR